MTSSEAGDAAAAVAVTAVPTPVPAAAARAALPHDDAVEHVADVFSLLGDPARVRILSALLNGRMRVRDLAAAVGSSESSVSHALRLLRAHRVVSVHRHGREAHYEIDDAHVRALLQLALDHVGHANPLHPVGDEH
ncbi:ArsR/SmtB family transcription factor [Schumannella soli]|uniref:Winged helix-turn-helix transcriptional regulator n=1 Tax=Schumannella soli TaxID=2590779 RepID=A0A506Y583_9MICO|nr:metalloregulator ArsR/SmtB family transcription factor [Schumannella soli]TPW77185.1 winged helix-turn-helix transcriptional regulator [Schumannella soli]